ncbi:hypothetical protein [Escherichia coli]|uniref:hypothetical protein n=1 Tax=Escherichia coli TaxID=562 RepID=UPI0037DCED02
MLILRLWWAAVLLLAYGAAHLSPGGFVPGALCLFWSLLVARICSTQSSVGGGK